MEIKNMPPTKPKNKLIAFIALVLTLLILTGTFSPTIASNQHTETPNTVIVVEEPTLHPPYDGGTCTSGWWRYTNNRGHYAYLTLNTNDPNQSTNWAEWVADLPETGTYLVEAYIPTHEPITWPCPPYPPQADWDTSDARYTVSHANGQTTVSRDQAPIFNNWLTVGTYLFNAGSGVRLSLTDLNGEPNLTTTVSFSAVRFTLVEDTTPPTGNITSPADNATIGPSSINFSAQAADVGSGVKEVAFSIRYDGAWHLLGSDTTAPYAVGWETPASLHSQQLKFTITIEDNAGNVTPDAGGVYLVNFVESSGSTTIENWIPSNNRAYLNQRSLSPSGDYKCGAASASMVLAMNGRIAKDYNTMAAKANQIYIPPNYIWDVRNSLNNNGMVASYACVTSSSGWTTIKNEINAAHPVIVLSNRMTYGHYFVVVGYRELGSDKDLIVYDPYGKWTGVYNSYDRNTTSPSSDKGKWIYYDYEAVWGYTSGACPNGSGYLITARPQGELELIQTPDEIPTSPPDLVSDEPENIGVYEGIIEVLDLLTTYLPLIIR